jgi:hypothetical protein
VTHATLHVITCGPSLITFYNQDVRAHLASLTFTFFAAFRAALIGAFAGTLLAPWQDARAEGPRVHVRGTSRIDAHAARAGGKLLLSGTLVDDAARAVVGEKVALTITMPAKGNAARPLPIGSGAVAIACGDNASASGPTLERADSVSLKTDDGGRFCVRLTLPVDRYVAHLSFSSAGSIDSTQIDLPIDLALKPLSLAFDPLPRALSLEGPPAALEVVATIDDDGASTPGANLRLSLTNEAGASLSVGTTNGSGRVRFAVPPELLGPPGRGELRVSFTGNNETGPSHYVAPIERHAKVELAVAGAANGRLAAGVPEDGVPFDVIAHARTPDSAAASTPGGTVEARVGETIVGAASLEGGTAHVVVTFAAPAASQVTVRLRYAPEAPWFEAGNDIAIALPIRGPSAWRHTPIVVAGLAVIAWLALGRTRTRVRKDKPPTPRKTPFHGEANVEVLRARPEHHGWSGHVVDAHESSPVSGARVAIERAGFNGVEVITESQTADDGSFALLPIEAREGDRLTVEGPLHSALHKPLPPSGDLAIGLVLRKRALLDRLVVWARGRGKPFDVLPEATPGHVRRAAGAELPVARWADAVERAAFGGRAIDANAEEEIDRLAPERVQRELGIRAGAYSHDTLEDPPREESAETTGGDGVDRESR